MSLEVTKIFRIYKALGSDGSIRNAFHCSMSPDGRLSSEKYNIKMGYWGPNVASCFLEVFLRRRKGAYRFEKSINIAKVTQAQFHIAEFILKKPLKLYSIAQAKADGVCKSAVYSFEEEKDSFVKDISDQGYDGIEYNSNHHSDFHCYALFEATIANLRVLSLMSPDFGTRPMSMCPSLLAEIIQDFEGIADVNFES